MEYELTPEDLQLVQSLLERHEARVRGRCERPYDGVMGQLPSWFPEWHSSEFIRIRDRILDEPPGGIPVAHEDLISWIKAYADAGDGGGWPDEIGWAIERLAHYRYVASLGEMQGLEFIGGRAAANGAKLVTAGRIGHQRTHGTEQEKEDRWRRMQDEVDRLQAGHPEMSKAGVARIAATNLKVSERTIRRKATFRRPEK